MNRSEPEPSEPVPPPAARWVAAVLCIVYGFAKINGAQFTVLDSELARPLGQVSGFWLTWHYFGHSVVYGTVLALIQIAAGVLLILPRTALAGALLLLPVAINIALIDVFYGVDLGGTMAAFTLLVCVCLTIAPYVSRLRTAVLLNTLPVRPTSRTLVALVVVVSAAGVFTWWVANYNNRSPTPIDGVWAVTAQTVPAGGDPRWRQVFFERNRAHMVVFRGEGRPDETHHFEVDASGVVRIWETWLTKGPLLMQGQSRSAGHPELELDLVRDGGHLVLQRQSLTSVLSGSAGPGPR
jgi:hypothetical protein